MRTVACEDTVIAQARKRADRPGKVLPSEQRDGAPPAELTEQVRHSYLGLTLEEAEAKAAEEGRALRVTVQVGAELSGTHDLQPDRRGVTLCQGIVVDTLLDLEHRPGLDYPAISNERTSCAREAREVSVGVNARC